MIQKWQPFVLILWSTLLRLQYLIINPHFVYSAVLEDQYYRGEQGIVPPQQLMSDQNGPLIGSTVVVV